MAINRSIIEEAAFICTIFLCDRCHTVLEADYPKDGYIERLADMAISDGWLIESSDHQLCRNCRGGR